MLPKFDLVTDQIGHESVDLCAKINIRISQDFVWKNLSIACQAQL